MKITFLGATRMVTGSCYLIETGGRKVLVDCGMFQGSKLVNAFNERDFVFNPGEIDAMVLTHAHIDHSGLIPKLVAQGYKGLVYCTKTTLELCGILLPDSAHIHESDAEFANRKGMRAGRKFVKPLYTVDEAYAALKNFVVRGFDEEFDVIPGIKAKFKVAGHIAGSAIAEIFAEEDGKKTKIIFTGDVGQPGAPILEDPEQLQGADFIITESTYGNRVHKVYDKAAELAEIVNDTAERGGNIIIPAFAVGRTQVLLYYFQKLAHEGKISSDIPIYIDSPMANKATQIVLGNPQEFDDEARAIYEMQGRHLLSMKQLHFTATAQESRMINEMPGTKIILSASGMCDAGRILHHLKHNLWREDSSVIIAGYQADGCLGRKLIEGVRQVKIMGEDIRVNARIYNLKGFSAHADKEQLLNWYGKMAQKPKAFFVTHGEVDASMELAGELQRRIGTAAYIPQYGDSVNISGSEWQVTEAAVASDVPEVAALKDYLKNLERTYLQHRAKIEQVVARDSGSLKLCLQHYSPRYSDKELKILLRDAQEVFPETVLTRDRMAFDIPLKDNVEG